MSTTIEDRVVLLLLEEAQEPMTIDPQKTTIAEKIKTTLIGESKRIGRYGFWETLENATKISAQRWRKAYARRQRPTPDMIEALAKLFPKYAFWLATGITDAASGHVSPMTAQSFPERLYTESNAANTYFQAQLELQNKLFAEGKVDVTDEKQRMYAAQRTRPFAHWWESALGNYAYEISRSEEYDELKALWQEREDERKEYLAYIHNANTTESRDLEPKTEGLRKTPMLGVDPRTKHQTHWDLFYKPLSTGKTKFALSVLNVAPADLSDGQLETLCGMSLRNIQKYAAHHGIDKNEISHFKSGRMISWADGGLLPEEIERLRAYVLKQREK